MSISIMLRNLLFTTALLVVALAPSPARAQGSIASGETVTGAIVSGGASTTWTFAVNTDDAWVVSIGELTQTAAISPRIRVYDAGSTLVASSYGTVAAAVAGRATAGGTFSIVVDDAAVAVATGTYQLSLALSGHAVSVPGGDEGGAMTNGVRHTGGISVGELDVWTITANAGDAIVARMGETTIGSTLTPRLLLYSPAGVLLDSGYGTQATEVVATAPLSGEYMLVAHDFSNGYSGSGAYEVTLSRSGAAVTTLGDDEGGAVSNGILHTGELEVGDLDVWTVDASAGDAIVVRMGETVTGSSLTPELRIYSPAGVFLDSSYGTSACEVVTTAPLAGQYIVIASDYSNGYAGNGAYRLTLGRSGGAVATSGGDEGGPLTNASMYGGALPVGDMDLWTVTLTAGDAFVVRMGETVTGSSLTPELRIYSPAGVYLDSGYGTSACEIAGSAPVSGQYLVIASDYSNGYAGSGAYRLTLASTGAPVSVSPGDEGGPMTNGVHHTGTLDVGDMDVWTVTANAGDAIVARMGELVAGSGLTSELRIYSPAGVFLDSNYGTAACEIVTTAPLSGEYLVIASDYSNGYAGSGEYRLTLARSNTGIVTSNGDEGGPLTMLSGGLLPAGDLDLWSLNAVAGQPLVAAMEEIVIGSSLTPELRLYSPSGALLKSSYGVSRAQVNATANVTGTYLLIASDYSNGFAGSGAYRLAPNYTTGVGDEPRAFALAFAPAAPNPCVGSTLLRFSLPHEGRASLAIFDPQGRLVRTLLDEPAKPAGEYTVTWDARGAGGSLLSPGVYMARLVAGGRSMVQKVLIAR